MPTEERQIKIWKPLSTTLVILACLLSFTHSADAYDTPYTLLILGGLLFSMAGDALLIFQANPKAFLAGLVAHLVYISAFVYAQSSLELDLNGAGEVVATVGLVLVGGGGLSLP